MITIKNRQEQEKMIAAGELLSSVFLELNDLVVPDMSTFELDVIIETKLKQKKLVSQSKGYKGYKHASCISVNDEVVHGVPSNKKAIKNGDLVKVDVCAAFNGYCADMTRCFFVGKDISKQASELVDVANLALNSGIEFAKPGGRLGDISHAIQQVIEKYNFGIVRDFAGHGIGRSMHEDPEILNYGEAGKGILLKVGMAFALEPMITLGNGSVYIMPDRWTARTIDGSLAAHVEDTVIVTDNGPLVTTRLS
jgi:methionyl aminopeptidase